LDGFLNLSLSLEHEIVPEFASLVGVEKEHRSSFWKNVERSKFCWIDTDATLRNATWQDFFRQLATTGNEKDRRKKKKGPKL
jgi:hypothetical protein